METPTLFCMIERFKNIFEGLDRAHGVTLVGESNGDGNKIKGKSFVKREPVTDKGIYDMAKSFAESVGKGEIEAKPEAQEQTKKSLNL